MRPHGKTWWGQRFLAALEEQMDSGRLRRGRGYSGPGRILAFEIGADGSVHASVRGNINPYFGVTKEPHYRTEIRLRPIPAQAHRPLIEHLGGRADLVSRLLMNEMPDDIDQALAASGFTLLPRTVQDLARVTCSCPDPVNPCKHIAGVYYRLAAQLDQDPLLLFELRGLPRTELRAQLARTPLGEALAPLMSDDEQPPPQPAASLYPPLHRQQDAQSGAVDPQTFWRGRAPLPEEQPEPPGTSPVPAVLVKKGGDFPPFWDRPQSFIAVMEELYRRVASKNRKRL
jgi:uncharacterized Zn finger protein